MSLAKIREDEHVETVEGGSQVWGNETLARYENLKHLRFRDSKTLYGRYGRQKMNAPVGLVV